ncbi:MAG TPA: ATP-binding protein [Fimbriimonadaceae bacterium]|nr:ATP-binding protein [Fimbriimonadaceae bacterium]
MAPAVFVKLAEEDAGESDVADVVERDRDIEQLRAELQEARAELESFLYSISHDLRAPLRSIDGFGLALYEDYGDKLGADGLDYLNRIRAGAKKMTELIDGLLVLSRTGRAEVRREPMDLSALAHEAFLAVNTNHQYSHIELRIETGLEAECDKDLARRLLENLIGNACKFSARSAGAKIEVGRDGNAFFVRDNGIGFDMSYANKLFKPFEHLHDVREIPGVGVGLAAAKRIVAKHEGRIWAEAAPEEGATFWFTLAPEA